MHVAQKCRDDAGHAGGGAKTIREIVAQKHMYCFNLTSLQDSELILAATFHFSPEKCSRHHKSLCRCSENSACHLLHLPPVSWLNVVFHSFGENLAYEQLKENVDVSPHRQEAWSQKDISHIIRRSRRFGGLLLCAELDSGKKYRSGVSEEPASHWPYILVYANDLAISEANSLALSLLRYDPFPSAESLLLNSSRSSRTKRGAHPSFPVQSNELPGTVENRNKPSKQDLWRRAYKSLQSKASHGDRKRKGQEDAETLPKSRVLNFDEKTMKEAQQKQWSEPTVCSRRYMKVDFADIGWNEWVISPKSFDAYYCAGGCKFPMPKIVRPSNHATIQGIVKAVGIIPGIPEPACVPNAMNSLSVLFRDRSDNLVLKVYPNMSVDSCACR
ncbi:PREDICTED: growth/differentiation factor 10 [Gekko japonicus]|uniref:Growth/differentiation factor 10 n=1 Tax=Gekko japonicus TaxID=146911 RepID=A0ABM1JX72_GEKJA|nr:PREDICTED: growth/differentiation factor 10 [Gekko japonicus]